MVLDEAPKKLVSKESQKHISWGDSIIKKEDNKEKIQSKPDDDDSDDEYELIGVGEIVRGDDTA
jgi:hypothetical protein